MIHTPVHIFNNLAINYLMHIAISDDIVLPYQAYMKNIGTLIGAALVVAEDR
jgi:ethanolamine ammonia-lyase large subunit